MLVLSRRQNEVIVIGDAIRVTVIRCRDGVCRLGIEAPPDITVHRLEVYEAIQREKENANESDG